MLMSAPWRQGAEAVSSWQVSAQREQLTELAGSKEHSPEHLQSLLYRAVLFTVAVVIPTCHKMMLRILQWRCRAGTSAEDEFLDLFVFQPSA